MIHCRRCHQLNTLPKRTYCPECSRILNRRRYDEGSRNGNRWDNANRWEKVLNEQDIDKALVKAAETRFYGNDLSHQLRVLRETGHTGVGRY